MDSRLIKPKALMLKDYLLDDMSSCSSNGFKSFPRRQCCTSTVRFLIQIDHKNKQQRKTNNINYLNFNQTQLPALPKLSRSRSALSALRSVISAVKRLPFAAASPPENKNLHRKSAFLPRSISVKITSFWRRKSPSKKEIGRWKSFDELLKEDSISEPSEISNDKNSRPGNGFTVPDECRSGNSPSSDVDLDLPDQARNDTAELLENGDVSTDSTANSSTKQWAISEEKEQLSPVSVLDCPFDDDEEVSSPYQRRTEGGTQMQETKRFAHLEPVSLAKQFELHLPINSSNKCIGLPIESEQVQENDYESQAEQKALRLINQMDDNNISSWNGLIKIKGNTLLLDFFRENIIARSQQRQCCDDRELLEEAENWMNERKPRELFLGWEVSGNREAYIKDMEKTKEWKFLVDDENNEATALELGDEVFDALLDELLLDISSTF